MFHCTHRNFSHFSESKHELLTHVSRAYKSSGSLFVAKQNKNSFSSPIPVSYLGFGKRLKSDRVTTLNNTNLFVCDEYALNAEIDDEFTASISSSPESPQVLKDVHETLSLYIIMLATKTSQKFCNDWQACLRQISHILLLFFENMVTYDAILNHQKELLSNQMPRNEFEKRTLTSPSGWAYDPYLKVPRYVLQLHTQNVSSNNIY